MQQQCVCLTNSEWRQRSNTTRPTPSCAKRRASGTARWSSPTAAGRPKWSTRPSCPWPGRSCGLWKDRGGRNPGENLTDYRGGVAPDAGALLMNVVVLCFNCACRRLWQHVTKSLKEGNIDEATEHKHRLEERQRGEEKQRAADNKPWTPKYFTKEVRDRPCDDVVIREQDPQTALQRLAGRSFLSN